MDTSQQDNFIRVLQAILHVCQLAAGSVKKCVSTWHSDQIRNNHLKRCTQPHVCSKVKGKPKNNTSCKECTDSAQAIVDVHYPSSPNIVWKNIDSSLLYDNAIEVCNGFALHLPPGDRPTQIDDYDTASILKIMCGFSEYHNNNTCTASNFYPCTTIGEV